MTRIGVLSDTHLRGPDPELARAIHQAWGPVDLIMHAGDLTSLAVLDSLAPPEVVAVCGNMDGPQVSSNLPQKRTLELEGFRLGLVHGWGSPMGLASRVRGEFKEVDCIVFGHSHLTSNTVKDGVLMFNPGSAGGSRIKAATVGLLTIDNGIRGEIIRL